MRNKIIVLVAAGLVALLAACDKGQQTSSKPSFYLSLASPSAQVDAGMARDMISAYRRNNNVGPLVLDAPLQRAAEDGASSLAASDRPASTEAVKARMAQSGAGRTEVNVSAGYHTLAETFSGWRDSPQHRSVMLSSSARRMGIATAYAPGSKYKVYWVMIVAP